jgi:hypothetical protein
MKNQSKNNCNVIYSNKIVETCINEASKKIKCVFMFRLNYATLYWTQLSQRLEITFKKLLN